MQPISNPNKKLPSSQKSGFTFLEVLLSMVIIVTITSFAIPVLYNFVRSPLSLASNQLASIISDLKFKSILSNRYLTLEIDPDKNVYSILEQNIKSGEWEMEKEFQEPIPVIEEVDILNVTKGLESVNREHIRLLFEPSGLIELVAVSFYFEEEKITLEVKDVFGTVETSEIESYYGFIL